MMLTDEQIAELGRLEGLAQRCVLPDVYVGEDGTQCRIEKLDWYSTCAGDDFMRGVMPSLFLAIAAERKELTLDRDEARREVERLRGELREMKGEPTPSTVNEDDLPPFSSLWGIAAKDHRGEQE